MTFLRLNSARKKIGGIQKLKNSVELRPLASKTMQLSEPVLLDKKLKI